ncbi:MAG: alanine--tRNA ligase [Clostridia bacterium]|nr:alanine--tRNA ligase [Clostridia bacterium]
MKNLSLNQLRSSFLDFFESKEHLILESASLIPNNDKSLLLINSGMAPMKKFFTGEVNPPKKRIVTVQKCIRTPDIESVGKSSRHGTFFEMLGNFSFGDYFKKEAVDFAFEYLTKIIELPLEKLYFTVYKDDDETFNLWKEHGISENHIYRFGKEDNFWEHGEGPCGPCTEIFYDRGENFGCHNKDCSPGCDCDRYVEIWNLVFSEFESDGKGHYTPLKQKNIDTGMGLERLACVVQEKDNLFEIDANKKILNQICKLANVEYKKDEKTDISVRIITDHLKSSIFMLSDGIMPSNEGRGYVLRRIIRRACKNIYFLDLKLQELVNLSDTVIEEFQNAYPLLCSKKGLIKNVLLAETNNFEKTLTVGLDILDNMIDETKTDEFSYENAFKLSDTYGFPFDLTKDILSEKGMYVDEENYNKLVMNQRESAREDRLKKEKSAWKNAETEFNKLPETEFLGYDNLVCDSKIIFFKEEEKNEYSVVLDKTVFYPEGGGQTGDSGKLISDNFEFDVFDTQKTQNGIIIHKGKLLKGNLSENLDVHAEVNIENRRAKTANHTAAHMLLAALRETLGLHIEQAGSYVDDKILRFDFVHFNPMSFEELKKVENRVNEVVFSALDVNKMVLDIDEAKKLGAVGKFEDKYSQRVRCVKISDYSFELCGGTHIDNTAQVGIFKILSEVSVSAGVRRITAVTSRNAYNLLLQKEELLSEISEKLKIKSETEIIQKLDGVIKEVEKLNDRINELESEKSEELAKKLEEQIKEVGKFQLIVSEMPDLSGGELKNISNSLVSENENLIVILASVSNGKLTFACSCGKKAIENKAHAGKIVKQISSIAGGSGGGKPDSAMAGGKDISKLKDALNESENVLLQL